MKYNKLVRGLIPQLIEKSGEYPIIRVLELEEYRACLEQELDEEVADL